MEQVFTDETFDKKDFKATPLKKGEYEACIFRNCDLSGVDLSDLVFIDCEFIDSNLSLVRLVKTAFRDITFKGCKMMGLQFRDCSQFGLSFRYESCILDHSSFYQTKIKKTPFKNTQ